MLGQVALQPRNLHMSRVESVLLVIQLGVQIGILLLPVHEEILLVVDLLSESLDHVDVDLNSASIVFLHSPLFIGYSIEVLLQVQKLVLKVFVLALSLSQVHGLLSKLGYKPIFLVLNCYLVV